MAHKRKDIRDAVKAMLLSNTTAGTSVFVNRTIGFEEQELPALTVFIQNESAEQRSLNSRQSIRTLELKIQVTVQDNSTLDDSLDAIALEVETLITSDPSLTGTALSTIYQNTNIETFSDGEKLVGTATITFETKYIQ